MKKIHNGFFFCAFVTKKQILCCNVKTVVLLCRLKNLYQRNRYYVDMTKGMRRKETVKHG